MNIVNTTYNEAFNFRENTFKVPFDGNYAVITIFKDITVVNYEIKEIDDIKFVYLHYKETYDINAFLEVQLVVKW